MALPTSEGYPAAENPIILRVPAVLLPANAWDVTPLEVSVVGFRYITLMISYLRAAAGGRVDFYLEASLFSNNINFPLLPPWGQQAIFAGGAVVTNTLIRSLLQPEIVSYGAVGAGLETVIYPPIDTGLNIERLRLTARENPLSGVAAGTFGAYAFGNRGA